ncbi:HipA N-terminal domain-containing protein [Taibaiella koreensis]|uniref:HipA N-terminal domain-containing protein n=1 Tax=Taibaiella koreensis TaxID=1268548 RepID=UPI000E59E5D0|nr:HipA N-terminal domain-containing protein [Taibaiella koreensis]
MRGLVYNNGELAGYIVKNELGHFRFQYNDAYFFNEARPPVSLSLPKSQQEHYSEKLFSFFFGLLSEGVNKDIQCRAYQIDERDHFTRLLLTAGDDTIGAITVKPENDELFRVLYG